MKFFRNIFLLTVMSLAAAAQAEPYSPEVEALLKPMPDRVMMMGNIMLTMDEAVQTRTQEELAAAMQSSHAVRGCMIVLNAATGHVLAMDSKGAVDVEENAALAARLPQQATPAAALLRAAAEKEGITLRELAERLSLEEASGVGVQGDEACILAADGSVEVFSPMHLASVLASFANGGERVQPRVIKGLRLEDGQRYLPTLPAPVTRVVSAETAAAVLQEGTTRTGADGVSVSTDFRRENGTPLITVQVLDSTPAAPAETPSLNP